MDCVNGLLLWGKEVCVTMCVEVTHMKVELNDVIDAMDASRNDENVLFDLDTYQFIYPDGNADEAGNYVDLPRREDLNDYKIMEDFIASLDDEKAKDWLANAIQGKGAFRRFRAACDRFLLLDDWYDFEEQAHRDQAIQWCEDNGILYEEQIIGEETEFDWNDDEQFQVQEEKEPEYRHEPIRIVPVTERNCSSVILLVQKFDKRTNLDGCMEELTQYVQDGGVIYALADEGRMVGIIRGKAEKEHMLCDMLYVEEEYRRHGYARKLVEKLNEEYPAAFALKEDDHKGRAFLNAIGYGKVQCILMTA